MPPLSSVLLLQLALGAYAAGIGGSLLSAGRERVANLVGFGGALLAGLLGMGAALVFLLGPPVGPAAIELWPSLVPQLTLSLRLDPLGAFFVLIVSLLAVALAIYSFGYARGFYGRRNVGVLAALFNGLLLAIILGMTWNHSS